MASLFSISSQSPPARLKPSRKCHDCGKATNDYRCPACRLKWRRKHDIPEDAIALSED